MKSWKNLEGYHKGAIYSRNLDNYIEIPETFVLCTIPRLYTLHCGNELKAADDILIEFNDVGIPIIFASTDSPEVAESYFSDLPVGFPFIRINKEIDESLILIDEFGDAERTTWFIKDGKPIRQVQHEFDSERDIWLVLQKAKEVLL